MFEVDLDLLKRQSCYFAKCFHKLPQEALRIPLELQDVKPEVFEALLLFMQTGYLDADPFTALDLYEAAVLLGVHKAIKEIKRVSAWLNHDYTKRQQYLVQLLKCIRFSMMNREEIVHCFHPPLLSNIARFPSVAFMILGAFGDSVKTDPVDEPVVVAVEDASHTQAVNSKLQRLRQDSVATKMPVKTSESRGFVSSGDSPQMMPSPVREPFTPILKVVIKEVQESLGESSNSLIESGSAKGATSLLMPSVKLVPPPKKEDRAYDRATTYDSKSTFTAMSTGSFEGQDPFNRTQQGNFVVPPSMATRIQKPDGALPVIPKSSIVVMGGLNLDTGITGSVVAFDPSFNTVQQCGTLPTPLHHHRAVLSGSDIFIVGGMLESTEGLYVCSKRCYKLSVPTLQWTRVADLKTERAHHGIVLLPGRILVFGGLTLGRKLLSSMEYYDIKRNKWTKMKSSLPQATMAMGAALFRSLVWIAGGVVDSGSNNLDCSSAVQCYNPETKAWTFMAPTLPMSCGYLSLVSDGSSLLAVGGSVSLDQLQLGSVPDVYALSADQRTWEPMPSLPRPCHSSAAVAFGQRANLYVFGGISNGNVLADVQVLQKGRWTTCAHLQATLLGLSAVALPPAHATPPELDLLDKGRRDDDLIVWSWHNL
ncbi:unnamed protein product [Ixodes pacificus]